MARLYSVGIICNCYVCFMNRSFAVFLLLLFAAQLFAQRTITGSVVDDETSAPLPRVRVIFGDEHGGTKHDSLPGVYTDSLGRFTIHDAPVDLVELDFAMSGYHREHLHIDPNASEINVRLHVEETTGDAVEVSAARYETVVEDACCNIDAMNVEFAELASFSPSPVEILRRYSSCTSSKVYCSLDHSSGIRLRGLDGTRVHLRLDNMPVFGALSMPFALEHISAGAVQSLNIFEGVSSPAYGNGAISGVVDIATRLPIEPSELAFAANGASEFAGGDHDVGGARDLTASYAGGVSETFGVAAYVAYNGHSGEFDDAKFVSLTPDYDRVSFMAKTRGLIDASRLTVSLIGAFEDRSTAPGPARTNPINDYSETINTDKLIAQAKLETVLSESANLFIQAAATNVGVSGHYGSNPFDATENVLYASAVATDLWGDHLVKFGTEFRKEQIIERSSFGIASNYNTISAFAEDEWILAEDLQVFAAARFDEHSIAGSLLSPRAGLTYKPDETVKIRLSTGQGFKGQALFDEEHMILHGAFKYRANPGLGYEKSWTYNIDVAHDYDLGWVAGGINFIGYFTALSGRAVPQLDSLFNGTYYPINSDQPSRLYGIEITTRPVFDEHWSGAIGIGAVHYEHGILHSNEIEYVDAMLVPSFTIDLSVAYRDVENGWIAETWGSIIGPQKLDFYWYGREQSPIYGLFNVRLSKKFGIVTIHTGILNMFDQMQSKVTQTAITFSSGLVDATDVWGPLEGREFFLGFRVAM